MLSQALHSGLDTRSFRKLFLPPLKSEIWSPFKIFSHLEPFLAWQITFLWLKQGNDFMIYTGPSARPNRIWLNIVGWNPLMMTPYLAQAQVPYLAIFVTDPMMSKANMDGIKKYFIMLWDRAPIEVKHMFHNNWGLDGGFKKLSLRMRSYPFSWCQQKKLHLCHSLVGKGRARKGIARSSRLHAKKTKQQQQQRQKTTSFHTCWKIEWAFHVFDILEGRF